jgi:hypothetical protein
MRLLVSCTSGNESLLDSLLRGLIYKGLNLNIPESILDHEMAQGWVNSITIMQTLGQCIVAYTPTARSDWWEATDPRKVKALVPESLHSGSAWKVPRAPTELLINGDLRVKMDFSGIVWVAICLHAEALCKYLGSTARGFYLPFICLNYFFLFLLNRELTAYQKLNSKAKKKELGHIATAGLYSFIFLAERGFGGLHQKIGKTDPPPVWDTSMSDHVVSFCRYHLEKIKKDFETIYSKEESEEYLSFCTEYEVACAEIAQIDISKWVDASLNLGAVTEMVSDDEDDEDGEDGEDGEDAEDAEDSEDAEDCYEL